jgi:hypothetical protein
MVQLKGFKEFLVKEKTGFVFFALFYFTLSFLVPRSEAGSPVIWGLSPVKAHFLTPNLDFSTGLQIQTGSVDPSSVAVNAPAGSLYLKDSGGLYLKTDAGLSVNWTNLASSVLSMATFGSSPNNNGATISAGILTLQPADATHQGGVSTGSQTFAGNKTFTGSISSSNLSGTNTGDQTITLTGDVTGTGTASVAATVSKIQGTTVSGTTGTTNAVFSSAPTLVNPVVGTQSQSDNSTKAASTAYVDTAISNAVSGVNPAVAVQAATTAASDTSGLTYNNGVSGVGATFTGVANTALTVDGYTFTAVGQRLLVKNDTQSPSGAFNGVYYVTQIQTAILPIILTRALDYDMPSDINSTGAIPVINGTTNGTTEWVLTSQVATVGTDPLTFTEFTRNPADNLLKANNLSDVNNAQTSFNNLSAMTLLGDMLYGGASGTRTVLAGNTSATKKYLSQTGTGSVSAAPSWSQPAFSELSGTAAINQGGTGQTTKAAAFDALSPMTTGGDIIYGGASGTGTRLANGSSGQYLKSAGGTSAPSWSTFTAPTIQVFTSSSGTYTTPGGVLYIKVTCAGGGGGGGGRGAPGSDGVAGGNTTFGSSLLTANGGGLGKKGDSGGALAGAGGTATVSAPASTLIAVTGGIGGVGGGQADYISGAGGSNPLGGGAMSAATGSGTGAAGAANTGGGGAGGGGGGAGAYPGAGGGAGGYLEAIITSPSATYSYAVGAGGAGGGSTGGAGGSGYIVVQEFYQ